MRGNLPAAFCESSDVRYDERMNIARALILLILFLIVPRAAHACGCYPNTTVVDDYEKTDLVIIARMTAVTKGPSRFLSDISHVTMRVEKVFKGDTKTGAELTFIQGDSTLDCSWQFYANQIGETYLLYLYQPEKPSEPFSVSTCNRSKSVEYAQDDLLYLENIDKVRGRTRVSGVVERNSVDIDDESGHQVRITGKNKTYLATTDKDGVYEIYGLPPGRYSLEPVLQSGWKIDEWLLTRPWTQADWKRSELGLPPRTKVWFTLRPKQHFGANITLALNNRIAGRVITPSGQPLDWVCVTLVPVEGSGYRACEALTKADGSFAVEAVSAGSYRLVINYKNIRTSHQPFPMMYYPGVANAEAAQVLTVKFGESIEGLQFVVPNLSETVKFTGIVRYANGRPASDMYVKFITPKTADVDGNIEVTTDRSGRFSLTVLKGLRGEFYSIYAAEKYDLANCPQLAQTGKSHFETPHLQVEATENKTFELKLPVSRCR